MYSLFRDARTASSRQRKTRRGWGLRSLAAALVLAAAAAVALAWPGSAASAALPADARTSWARSAIADLLTDGVMAGYPDGTFQPQRAVTRAEFAKILAAGMGLKPIQQQLPFKDVPARSWASGWIAALVKDKVLTGYPDKTFRPGAVVTRAEAIAMLVRALHLDVTQAVVSAGYSSWGASFSDLPSAHWAYVPAEIAQQLKLLPDFFAGNLRPGAAATRADAAYMVDRARQLDLTRGSLVSVNSDLNTITVQPATGVSHFLSLAPGTLIVRNDRVVGAGDLRVGDAALVASTPDGTPAVIRAYGLVTQADLANKASQLTHGLLTPEEVSQAMQGDWSQVRASLGDTLQIRLLQAGATPDEASAILNGDWSALQGLARQRLEQALSTTLRVPTDLVDALLSRDWKALETLAQMELTTRLLGQILNQQS